jgi:hypothetical protein
MGYVMRWMGINNFIAWDKLVQTIYFTNVNKVQQQSMLTPEKQYTLMRFKNE